jgi:hypothetical protein
MSAKLLLSPLAILSLVSLVAAAELAAGTNLRFVSMAAVAMLSICVTYNMLGGLGTIAGIGFSGFALGTLMVAQIGKAILFERADAGLDVPGLTISVYAVYFFSLMLGTFTFSRIRLPLPRPVEPETLAQARYLYILSLVGGLTGSVGVLAERLAGGAAETSLTHGLARALAYLLPFSLVLAVDDRIKTTNGRHCFGWMALWPTLGMLFIGFATAGRTFLVEPFAIIFLTSHLRKYKFRKKHIFAAIGLIALFFFYLSPYFLYVRAFRDRPTISEEVSVMLRELQTAPAQWETIKNVVEQDALATPGLVNYFETPGAATLNRFALIGPDSTLINACSTGFHYGFTSINLDLLAEVPRFLYPNKPEIGSNKYLGHLDGQESDAAETTNSTITAISDSYGAFSWVGVIVFSFVVMPAIFVVYESIFDSARPWGTVATSMLGFGIAAGSMGANITETLVKTPIYIIVISALASWIIKVAPVVGDRAVVARKMNVRSVSPGNHPSASAP